MTDTATATTTHQRSLAEGIVRAMQDGAIALAIPNTDYELHLALDAPIAATVGQKVQGRITARARRIDKIKSGGRYIEPVAGRPRRIQGRVVAVDEVNDVLLVRAAVPIACRTNGVQKAGMFKVDQMVSFDVEPGARFEPVM